MLEKPEHRPGDRVRLKRAGERVRPAVQPRGKRVRRVQMTKFATVRASDEERHGRT
jgi:hypothetical protein